MTLTDAERKVFKLKLAGLVNKDVAQVIGCENKTVEWHCYNIRKKLGVKGMALKTWIDNAVRPC